jgi:hypothetical protein
VWEDVCLKITAREGKTTAPVVSFFDFYFKYTKYLHLAICSKWCECLRNILIRKLLFLLEVASKNYGERRENRRARGGIFLSFVLNK